MHFFISSGKMLISRKLYHLEKCSKQTELSVADTVLLLAKIMNLRLMMKFAKRTSFF